MKHRHSGRYWSRTPKGRWTTKQKPMHSQSLMRKYKNKPYPYLRRRFRINPILDDDKDGVRNYRDCRPWDRKRQDVSLSESEIGAPFFTRVPNDEDIFIGELPNADKWDVESIAKSMSHEVGDEAKIKFDNIVVPHFVSDSGELMNPKTASEVVGSRSEAISSAIDELEDRLASTTDVTDRLEIEHKLDKLEEMR